MEQSYMIDIKLERLSCPFTWKMEDVIQSRNKLLESNDSQFDLVVDIQDNFPEFVLIWHLMLAYENSMSNKLADAMNSVHEAELILTDIKEKKTLRNVENILEHIFVATKCHVLKMFRKLTEVNELLENIYKLDDTKMDGTESAMLNGCQCLAWSLYRRPQTMETINFAKKAVEYESTNGKWYFLLGKSYRTYRRRYQSLSGRPSQDETLAFQQAYKLSKNVLFGVSLARLNRESANCEEANVIYKEIYDLQPTCCTVRLQLALGFIRSREFELAKHCLDYVAERMPNSITYSHYMGIYEEKCNKDLKAALSHYRIAVDNSNYAAEWQYLECKKKIEPDWDPLPHLLGVLKKYEKDSDHVLQEINIQIGTYYLFEKRDIFSACLCLTKAIEIKPNARILKSHRLVFGQCVQVNIYHVLIKEIQFALQGSTITHDENTIEVLNSTLQLCRKYTEDFPSSSVESLSGSLRSQSLNRPRNRGRGFPSHRGIRNGQNRPNSISRPDPTSTIPTTRFSPGNHSSYGNGDLRDLSRENSPDGRRIKNESKGSNSQSTESRDSLARQIYRSTIYQRVSGGYKPRLDEKKNDTPRRSEWQTNESSRTELYRPLHISRNCETSSIANRVPVLHAPRNPLSKPRDKFESLEKAAGCLLVKTKNLNP